MQNEMQINRPEFIEPIPTSPKGPQTPTKSRSQSPVCPGAPVRPHRQLTLDEADIMRPPSLVIPSVADHRNKGILPDYFIKPEPGMPLWEKRKYILSEMERWFTSPLFHQHVKDAAILDEAGQLGDVTNWPAGIVYTHHKKLAWDNNYAETCVEVYERWCAEYLSKGGILPSPLTCHMDLCTLSDGKTILDHWGKSDLDGLRNAPPLPENDSSDDEEADEDEEEEEEDIEEVIPTFKMDIYIRVTLLDLLCLLILSALWLMINTYVLCKKYSC